MEELVKMLVDQGAIETSRANAWTLRPDKLLATHGAADADRRAAGAARWSAPAERLALQQASVIGLVFWDQALAALDAAGARSAAGAGAARTGAAAARRGARRRARVRVQPPDPAPRHLRHGAQAQQRALHARAAAWLAGQHRGPGERLPRRRRRALRAGRRQPAGVRVLRPRRRACASRALRTTRRWATSARALALLDQASQRACTRRARPALAAARRARVHARSAGQARRAARRPRCDAGAGRCAGRRPPARSCG